MYMMPKKLLRVAQKTVVSIKKIFHMEVTLCTKIMRVTEKCGSNKKNYVTPKRERLNMFSVAEKRSTC